MSWFVADGFRLRSAEASDADDLLDYLNDDEVYSDRQFELNAPWPLTRTEVEQQLSTSSDSSRLFVIETGGAVVGHVAVDWWWDALQPWVGIVVAPSRRRHGHGRRAATMILDFLFDETPAHLVVAQAGDWNEPGLGFAEAIGFSRAGRYRHTVRREGRWRDTITFDLLRREWEERRATDE